MRFSRLLLLTCLVPGFRRNGLANIADLSATSTPHRPRDVFGRCVSASPPLDCACYVPAELRPLLVIHRLTWRCVPDLRLRRTFKVRIDRLWLLNLHISYSQCCPAPSCSASRSRPPQTSPPHACINLGILLLRYSSSSSGMWVLGGCGCGWRCAGLCVQESTGDTSAGDASARAKRALAKRTRANRAL